jgi:hypothetical protein
MSLGWGWQEVEMEGSNGAEVWADGYGQLQPCSRAR